MRVPEFTQSEEASRKPFLALLQATSLPGSIHQLSQASYPENFIAIAEALIDLETTFFSPDPEISQALERTGARAVDVSEAEYQLWPTLRQDDLEVIKTASVGTMVYPDSSASLYLGCQLEQGLPLLLTGPGIDGEIEIQVAGVPESFWIVRNELTSYPLGWDVFLVHDGQVLAIPRSTEVNIGPRSH